MAQEASTGGSTPWAAHGIVAISPVSRSYTFEPKGDITAPELALALKAILPIITQRNVFGPSHIELIDKLPPEVKRHFRENPAG